MKRIDRLLLHVQAGGRRWLWLLVAFQMVLALGLAFDIMAIRGAPWPFWDLEVYVTVARAYALGFDPYQHALMMEHFGFSERTRMVSPPLVAQLYRLIGQNGGQDVLRPALIALHLAATAVIPLAYARLLLGPGLLRYILALAAFLTGFAAAGVYTLGDGNNGTLLYALIVAAMVPGCLGRQWWPFYAAVVVAGLFKPNYLAFLAIPVLAHGWSWRQLLIGTAAAAVCGAAYAGSALFDAANFQAWLSSLNGELYDAQKFGENVWGGVNRILLKLQGSTPATWIASCVQLGFAVLLGLLHLAVRPEGPRNWAFLAVALTFFYPRLLYYDVVFAAVPLAFYAAQSLNHAASQEARFGVAASLLAVFTTLLTLRGFHVIPPYVIYPLLVVGILGAPLWARLLSSFTRSRGPVAAAGADP